MALSLAALRALARAFDSRPAREIEAEIREELAFHVEEAAAEAQARGASPTEARAEALRRFGDLEGTARACRRAQLGDRIMLQRILIVLVVVLASSTAFLWWRSSVALVRAREAQHVAVAEAMHARAQAEELAAFIARAAGEPSSELGSEAWIEAIEAQPENWRLAWAAAEELASARSPEDALAGMQQLFPRLSAEQKKQALKPFVFHGGHPRALGVLDLAASDEDAGVRERAFDYLVEYAFREFGDDVRAYREWYEQHGAMPLEQAIRESLAAAVARLASERGDALATDLAALAEVDFAAARKAGVDVPAVLHAAGLPELVRRWKELEPAIRDDAVALERWLEPREDR